MTPTTIPSPQFVMKPWQLNGIAGLAIGVPPLSGNLLSSPPSTVLYICDILARRMCPTFGGGPLPPLLKQYFLLHHHFGNDANNYYNNETTIN